MPIYNGILERWRDPNPQVLTPWLHAACDRHTQESRFDTEKSAYDFGDDRLTRTPIEILLLFRLRQLAGLANPVVDHPLMATPFDRLPETQRLPNPKNVAKSLTPHLYWQTKTDERGAFEFFVPPGKYLLLGPDINFIGDATFITRKPDAPKVEFEIKDEKEFEVALHSSAPGEMQVAGRVVLKVSAMGGVTVYSGGSDNGAAVSAIGPTARLPMPGAPAGGLTARMSVVEREAAQAVGHPVAFEPPGPFYFVFC